MTESNAICDEKWCWDGAGARSQVMGIGTQGIHACQTVRCALEEKKWNLPCEDEWVFRGGWSFWRIPANVRIDEDAVQRFFGPGEFADMIVPLIDTADETAVDNIERIGRANERDSFVIAFLLGDGGRNMVERVASVVDCFVDLRDERMEQFKTQKTAEQIASILIRGIRAPLDEPQLVGMDYIDIVHVLFDGGELNFGIGYASDDIYRDDALRAAAKEAIQDLEMKCNLREIRRFYLIVEGSMENVSIYDLNETVSDFESLCDEKCDGIFSAAMSEDMKGKMRVIIFASEREPAEC